MDVVFQCFSWSQIGSETFVVFIVRLQAKGLQQTKESKSKAETDKGRILRVVDSILFLV
jgi:hypothetical protein